jgi:quercetin dioxygenase-like cupin family protein
VAETPVRKVAADALTPGQPTAGVSREEAIVIGDLWSGRALTEPGVASDWHHHGDHDTIAYVVRGALRVETATDVVQGEPGDFVHVPAHTVHRESNPTIETSEVVVIRRGTGPVVFNLDGPKA